MKDGFIKAAAGTIDVVVADVQYNTEQILARMREADAAGVNLLTLPELCLTGYTCGKSPVAVIGFISVTSVPSFCPAVPSI